MRRFSNPVAAYAATVTLAALLILLVGWALAANGARLGVLAGVGVGVLTQVGAIWILASVLHPTRRMLVYGLGMLVRLVVVAAVALAVVPVLELAPVATLFSLLAVLFVATLLEPVFFHTVSSTGS